MNRSARIIVAVLVTAAFPACGRADAAQKVLLTKGDLSCWVAASDWAVTGDALLNPKNENMLVVSDGNQVIVNSRRGNSAPLVSNTKFGDVRAHIEFVIPKNANSGVLFQGRYRLNICDSWGQIDSISPGLECGGIYPRWDETRAVKAYEGRSPRINASRPAGQWQSFDVIFRAPRFDCKGNKITSARFEKVLHNRKLIQENVEVSGPSRDSIKDDEEETGPIVLMGDRGPVAFRNLWVVPIEPDRDGLMNPFFAMDTGTIDESHKTAESQAGMLKELGYAGVGYWEREPNKGNAGLGEMLTGLDKQGLKLFSVYWTIKLDEPNQKFMPAILSSIELLRGRPTIVWLAITSDAYPRSSPAGDQRAVEIITCIADAAHEQGNTVALYPHSDFWLERIDDAVRLAQKANRRNVGVTFNLYHWLRTDSPENMNSAIKRAMPYLFVATVNGTIPSGSIETLDKGTFDVYSFLKVIRQEGFTGPIGLQGYGIGGDVRDNLSRSISAWRRFSMRLATENAESIDIR
jgi:sugar phosphate isomerase/epimerase